MSPLHLLHGFHYKTLVLQPCNKYIHGCASKHFHILRNISAEEYVVCSHHCCNMKLCLKFFISHHIYFERTEILGNWLINFVHFLWDFVLCRLDIQDHFCYTVFYINK